MDGHDVLERFEICESLNSLVDHHIETIFQRCLFGTEFADLCGDFADKTAVLTFFKESRYRKKT